MLLAIDTGNTNTVFAIFDGQKLIGQWRIATDARRTSDEYAVWLLQLMQMHGLDAKKINAAIVSSVVPQTLFDLRTLCRRYFNAELRVIGHDLRAPIEVDVDRPADVGADRLVNAYAAWKRWPQALIILDFGTATTFDVVSAKGSYIGGVIAPGVNLSLDALHRAAAKLPNVGIAPPERVIGRHTVAAMQSGIYYGYVGLIEGIVSRIRAEAGIPMKVIATGGLAPLYAKATAVIEQLEPDLTILGLRDMYQLHSNNQ